MAFRPKTLTAAVVPVFCAHALAHLRGDVQFWWVSILALFGALCIQIATNIFNDVIDFKKGADQAGRLGPKRVTQSGLIAPKTMYIVASVFLMLAFALGVPLVVVGGWPIVVIGLVSLFLAYAYTGGPFPLAYLGLGDLFVVLFFGLIAVGATFYLLSGFYSWDALVLGLQVGLLAAVLIAVNNARDMESDRRANKRTAAARFGLGFARMEITFFYVLAFALNLYWYYEGLLFPLLLSCLALPRAVIVLWQIWRWPPSEAYNIILGKSASAHAIFGLGFTLGCLL